MESKRRFPAFFKPYLPTSAKRMNFPVAYADYMKEKMPKTSILRRKDGRLWNVNVEKIGNDFFFVDGWDTFVQDNSLEIGDFLVFQYNGDNLYDVTLLGRHSTEKIVVEEDEEQDEETQEHMDEAEAETQAQVTASSKISEKAGEEKPDTKADKGKRKRVVTDPHDHEIFKSGFVSRPKNPYFLASVRKERRQELYVPYDFIQDHGLRLPLVIMLRDQDGRKWESKLKIWKDGRVWYYKGWGRLCRVNRVAENDICICELKKGPNGVQFFQVEIVREEMMLKTQN